MLRMENEGLYSNLLCQPSAASLGQSLPSVQIKFVVSSKRASQAQ